MSKVQELIDALALDLKRPVGLDDRQFRAISYSAHDERVDPVRQASILRRQAPREVIAWLEAMGVRDADRFIRVPANKAFGMAARVCVPVRFDSTLLGFLWLLDEPTPLSDAQLGDALVFAEELAIALYQTRLLEQGERERARDLAVSALGLDGKVADAGAALVSGGHLASGAAYLTLVLRAYNSHGTPTPDSVRVRLLDAAGHLRRSMAPHHMLDVMTGEEIAVILVPCSPEETERRAAALAESAGDMLGADSDWNVIVGVGESVAEPAGLPASYQQARDAVHIGIALGSDAGFVPWADLGAYRTIVPLLREGQRGAAIPAALRRLLDCEESETLIRTLECYLDLGGDARAAAEALFVHRSSLYGRLHRIEEVAGIDLHSGEDRLELHLGIRLLRLCPRIRSR